MTLNRDLSAGQDGLYHLVPIGEFATRTLKGRRVIQICDQEAINRLAQTFKPKALVDFEHRSFAPDGDTTAAGWITEVHARGDGLWGRIDWSDLGEAAVKNKRYRGHSPVLDLEMLDESRGRPVELVGSGLTNMGTMREALQPLCNKDSSCSHMNSDGTFLGGFDGCVEHMMECEGHDEDSATKICAYIARKKAGNKDLAGKAPAGDRSATTPENGGIRMKEVLKALGLPETAEEPSAVQAVNALKDRAKSAEGERDTAKNRVTEFEKAELDAKVAKALDDHKDKVTAANKADVEAMLRKDFDAAVKFLAGVKVTAGTTTLNRSDGQAPAGTTETAANKAQERSAEIEKLIVGKRMKPSQAWAHLATARPDLFDK